MSAMLPAKLKSKCNFSFRVFGKSCDALLSFHELYFNVDVSFRFCIFKSILNKICQNLSKAFLVTLNDQAQILNIQMLNHI